MSATLLKETQAHAMRWLRWQLGDESDRPMQWELFADGLERQRDAARNVAEQYISKANAYDAEVIGYRETIKALEAEIEDKQDAIQSAANQIDKWRNESRMNADRCHKSEEQNNQLEREIESMNKKLAQVEEQLASKDGYPAQPVDDGGPARDITLRDWFAGIALGHMPAMIKAMDENPGFWNMARHTYNMADAMLAARNGKEGA